MPLPDLTELDEPQLRDLLDAVTARLAQIQGQEQAVRETLLDPVVVAAQIDNLLTQAGHVQGVIDTPNSEIKANPQQHIIVLARAQKRAINNLIRVLRTSAGVLDSDDTGEEED